MQFNTAQMCRQLSVYERRYLSRGLEPIHLRLQADVIHWANLWQRYYPCLFHGGRISNSQLLILFNCTAAASVRFDGTQHLTLRLGMVFSEAENLSFRFKTKRKDTFLIATRTDDAADRLEIYLGNDGSAFNSIIRPI